MLDQAEIFQTIRMIESQKLDIRTITMGVSLLDAARGVPEGLAERVYDRVCAAARGLNGAAREIERRYGIPVVNTRVAVTPVALIAGQDPLPVAMALDRAASELNLSFIGGYSALVYKAATAADIALMDSLPQALSETERVCASVSVASTRAGINMDAVTRMGGIIKEAAYLTRERDSLACAKLVVFANPVEDNPFMAGAFHGVGEGDCVINVGVSGPGVVKTALEEARGQPFDVVAETIKRTAFKITRVGQLVALEASRMLGVPFGIVDLSLAPTPAMGDSVAHILEEMGLERAGAHGTTAALMLLNDAVKKGGVMASSHIGGLSGAFIPVSEDIGMIEAAERGALTLDKLEAMTAVCSVGLDMIALPGDTPAETISAIIADEAAIGVINNKTTAARLIPAWGKQAGDTVSFGGLLGHAPVMPVNGFGQAAFIARGGRIPAPIRSLTN